MNGAAQTDTRPRRPKALSVMAENIPAELKQLNQWVLWQYELKDNEWTKVPYQVNGRNASTTDSKTWTDFPRALATYQLGRVKFDGIGLVCTVESGIVGIDLDHCLDPNARKWEPRAVEILRTLNSYSELSPSGTGARIFVKGSLPDGRRKNANIEMYVSGRYLTLTGHVLKGLPRTIEPRQEKITEIHTKFVADKLQPKSKPANGHGAGHSSDDQLLDKAFAAKNGDKLKALFDGDTSGHNGDDSAADLALCSMLAFWVADEAQLDRVFRRSCLMRNKWDEKHGATTYGERTISKAWAGRTEHYNPNSPQGRTDFSPLSRTNSNNSRSQTQNDNPETHREEKAKPSPWTKAKSAPDFCAEEDTEIEGYAKDLVVPGAIGVIAAPRGIGKTLMLHALAVAMAKGEYFRGAKVKPLRVLLVDRDNPRQVVRQRIRGWGGGVLDAKNLKVLTREDAPDLKDKAAWEAFPVEDYDVVLIDSLGSFTEGVTEKEGKETTQMLATLLDFIRKGPGVVALTNCTKDALNTRGRGEWQDRVDIQYEVRDATGFSPSGKKDWWMELPEAGESAWADRAARRKSRIDYRLAFVPSKFRLGVQPEPFCLEVRLPKDEIWTLADVTEDLIEAGENTIKEAATKKEEREEAAVNALAEVVKDRHQEGNPILKDQAVTYLNKEMEISQKRSRELIAAYKGKLWEICPIGGKGGGSGLFSLQQHTSTTKKDDGEDPRPVRTCEGGISVGHAQSGRREWVPRKPAPSADLRTPLFSSSPGVSSQDLKEERAGIQDDDGFEDVPR